jgi:intracellular sulfur oxidation DsrE/DsrF family protein
VQNGVLPARKSPKSEALTALANEGVEVLADSFSLRERGIESARLATGVKTAEIDVVVAQLAAGTKTMFH